MEDRNPISEKRIAEIKKYMEQHGTLQDPDMIADLKTYMEYQNHLYRDTQQENRQKAGNTKSKTRTKNSDRKPGSNYRSRNRRAEKRVEKKERQHKGGTQFWITNPKTGSLLRYMPLEENEQNKIADDMIRWIQEHPEVTMLQEYPLACNISPKRFTDAQYYNEYFAQALEVARGILARRTMDYVTYKSQHGIDDKSLLEKRFPVYDDEYREYQRERDEAKAQKTQSSAQITTVEIPSSPSSDMVPEHTSDSRGNDDNNDSS